MIYRGRKDLETKLDRCYLRYLTPFVEDIFQCYRWWHDDKVLPTFGGWQDQPAIIIEAIDLLDEYMKEFGSA